MATAQIAYETTTGRILGLHHFAAEPDDPELTRREAAKLTELDEDQVAVISVPAEEVVAGRSHRVDVDRETLVEAEEGEDGVSHAIASTRSAGESPDPPGTS